jgi:hypothetical protein
MKNTMKNLLKVEGNYFSTYAFVQKNNLESTATQVLGNGWEAEDDCNQIQLIIDSLGIGNYSVGCIDGNYEDIIVTKISELTYKQNLAAFNQTIITINIVQLVSELADLDLRENWKDSIKIDEEDEDETSYTEEAQDVFDDLYNTYYSIIANAKV